LQQSSQDGVASLRNLFVVASLIAHTGEDSMAKKLSEPAISTHNLEDYPDYIQAIGMVSLEAVAMELRLALLLARALMLPLRTAQAIYLTPKAEQARIDIFRNAPHAAFSVPPSRQKGDLWKQKERALRDIEAIIGRAEKLIRHRHRIIHDERNYSDKEQSVTRKLIDGVPGRKGKPASKKELDDLIYEMRRVIDDAYDLSERLRSERPLMVNLSNSRTKPG
jgi:hypothetical protein